MSEYLKPLPLVTDRNRPYWDGLRAREIRLPRCRACGTLRVSPHRFCPQCGAPEHDWDLLSGRGTIWSRCVFHQVYFAGFRDEVPYNVAVIALEEGVRLYSNVLADNADVRIGRGVEAVFDDVTPDITLLKFRLTT